MQDKIDPVLVTGATGALGTDVCRRLLAKGYAVHGTYLVERELQRFPEEVRDNSAFTLHRTNLSDESEVVALHDAIGPVSGLCCIAGGFSMAPMRETSREDLNGQLEINLLTAFLSMREALKRMDDARGGSIVAVGAFALMRPSGGLGAYRASKSALMSLVETIAEETLTTNITINAVLPTVLDTPANRNAMPDSDVSDWVSTAQAADTVAWLLDPSNRHITGAMVPLRGRV